MDEENNVESTKKHSTSSNIQKEERCIQIAFLTNKQAELETQINLLKFGKTVDCISSSDDQKQTPSFTLQSDRSFDFDNEDNQYDDNEEEEEEKTEIPDLQEVESSREDFVIELQEALRVERIKCLDWMIRHNSERDQRLCLHCELQESMNKNMQYKRMLNQNKKEKETLCDLIQSQQRDYQILENALKMEIDNFTRIKNTLDAERKRFKAFSERDTNIIINLRTALEVKRENEDLENFEKSVYYITQNIDIK